MTNESVYLPAEWFPQDAILITWPHRDSAWADQLNNVEQTYLDLTSQISHYQDLIIQAHESIDLDNLIKKLHQLNGDVSRCHFVTLNSNDTWARDHGPITILKDDAPHALDFTFNGWGNKFQADLDDQLNAGLKRSGIVSEQTTIPWVLEGGSIESDGAGTLMTTEACLLNPNRNGAVKRSELELKLKSWFGVSNVLWLSEGELDGDDTDAHIDTLARFAPNNTIVYQGCQDAEDAHYPTLSAMANQLKLMTNAQGETYRLLELPFPKACLADDGHRLPATYANFLICNRQVIVPTYDDPADATAIQIIEQAFPDHLVTGVNALPLIEEHGSIHCITMQLPKGSVNFDAPFSKNPSAK